MTKIDKAAQTGITTAQHLALMRQIDAQDSAWRYERDKDEDYIHFRQRDSDAIRMLESRGIKIHPIDNFIGKACRDAVAVLAENKKDSRVIAHPNVPPEMADAISEKLSVAEDETFLDRQCLDAGYKQAGVGIEWLEAHRSDDPFDCPYKISTAPRNELFRDETVALKDWQNGRWMHQRKYIHWELAAGIWPQHRSEIERMMKSGASYDWMPADGGNSTGYISSIDKTNFWTTEERRWLDRDNGLINIGVDYVKQSKPGLVLVSKTHGRLEFDKNNSYHIQIASAFDAKIIKAPITVLTRTFFAGPLKLGSEIVSNGKFPYVPFYYFIDGRNGQPYGLARFMMSLQDEHNARAANDLWNLGAMRIKMTNGVVAIPMDEFRANVSKPNFIAVLNKQEIADGGIYEEKREYEISEEQYKRNLDLRQALREAAGTDDARAGSQGTGTNLDFVKPGNSLSLLLANHEYSRMALLDLLLDMVIEDSIEEEEVIIPAKMMMPEKRIVINSAMDDGTISNDVRAFRGKVRLDDVPSSPERRRQEIVSLSEFAKSVKNENIQNTITPWVVAHTSIPFKNELSSELRKAAAVPTEDEIQQRISEAVESALLQAKVEQENRRLDQSELKVKAEVEEIEATTGLRKQQAVKEGAVGIYSTMQVGQAVVANPAIIAPSQQVLDALGFEDANSSPVISAVSPRPVQVSPQSMMTPGAKQNTSPALPPVPAQPASPVAGAMEGIEKQGNQINSEQE